MTKVHAPLRVCGRLSPSSGVQRCRRVVEYLPSADLWSVLHLVHACHSRPHLESAGDATLARRSAPGVPACLRTDTDGGNWWGEGVFTPAIRCPTAPADAERDCLFDISVSCLQRQCSRAGYARPSPSQSSFGRLSSGPATFARCWCCLIFLGLLGKDTAATSRLGSPARGQRRESEDAEQGADEIRRILQVCTLLRLFSFRWLAA